MMFLLVFGLWQVPNSVWLSLWNWLVGIVMAQIN